MPTIDVLPANDKTNGWSRILPHREPRAALDGDVRADWVVVGAGFAGLAAAARLAKICPHDHVVVLEADEVGEGASGRNSGFAIDLPHNVGSSLAELEESHRSLRLARTAIEHLEAMVQEHSIDCQWERRGKYHAAVSTRGTRRVLEPFVKELDALGETYRWVDKVDLASEIGTAHFNAAVYTPGCILMNPAALTRGLAGALPDNVSLYEHTPVTAYDYRNGIRLTTRRGSVYAPKMIVAVNGFAEQFSFYRGSLMVFVSHASLTRPLDDDERAALGGVDNWGLTPVNAIVGITMRFTADRRILIRQKFTYQPDFRLSDGTIDNVRQEHTRLFHERFPMLPHVDVEHTWSGFVCLSRNQSPGFGRVAPNIYTAVCQNAIGVTKGTISGILAADMATDRENSLLDDMIALGAPNKLPLRPFLDLGVRARFAWEMWKDRAEA